MQSPKQPTTNTHVHTPLNECKSRVGERRRKYYAKVSAPSRCANASPIVRDLPVRDVAEGVGGNEESHSTMHTYAYLYKYKSRQRANLSFSRSLSLSDCILCVWVCIAHFYTYTLISNKFTRERVRGLFLTSLIFIAANAERTLATRKRGCARKGTE